MRGFRGSTLFDKNYLMAVKVTVVVLLWYFSTGLAYSLILKPASYIQYSAVASATILSVIIYAAFLFSPIAGFIADVKFGRFKMLLCGTYIILLSVISILIIGIVIAYTVHTFNPFSKILLTLVIIAVALYCIGDVIFVSNIVQFGTDQLRDAPTRYSVCFIYAYLWTDSLSNLITSVTNWPGHEIIINSHLDLIAFDKVRTILITVVLSVSVVSSIAILVLVHKNQRQWFMMDSIGGNPYRLMYNVLYFAIRHKKPIRRSAFTYCEDERPSRLDFGKRRYGGPYTTEQVENVKVALNMFKVLLSLGPIFLLEGAAISSFLNYDLHNISYYKVSNPLPILLINYGLLLPLSTTLCIPLYQCVIKPLLSKYTLNMFKRMGISLGVLTISFLVYLICDTLAYNSNNNHGYPFNLCWKNMSYVFNKSFVSLPSMYISVLQQILLSLCQMLLYISAYEFICCQSPQHMKGLFFGYFYALRAFYQSVAACTIYLFTSQWNSVIMSCRSGFYMFNISIGTISLIFYITVARKFKYRKRDDICNVYKFAEDYYSNSQ